MPGQRTPMLSTPIRKMALAALIAFSLDQLSKQAMLGWLDLATVHRIAVWPPYLNFLMAWNPGINFGVLGDYGARWVLVAVSVAVSLWLAVWASTQHGWLVPLAAGAVIGGALGNALDRVMYGAVVDFINMSCCGMHNPYAFNLADVWIAVGMVVIAVGHEKRHQ